MCSFTIFWQSICALLMDHVSRTKLFPCCTLSCVFIGARRHQNYPVAMKLLVGVSTGGSTGRLPAVPLRGCCKAVKAAGGEEKAAFVARKTGQGERAGAAGKGDGRHPRRRAAASRAGLATGTKPPRSAPRPRGGSFRGAAVAAPLCRCRAETARGAGRREAEPRGARSR